jgi:hypothetical protein
MILNSGVRYGILVPWVHHAILYLHRLYHEFVGQRPHNCCVRKKTTPWSNTPSPAWTTTSFVSMYQLELPKKEDIQRFLEEKMREDIGYGG